MGERRDQAAQQEALQQLSFFRAEPEEDHVLDHREPQRHPASDDDPVHGSLELTAAHGQQHPQALHGLLDERRHRHGGDGLAVEQRQSRTAAHQTMRGRECRNRPLSGTVASHPQARGERSGRGDQAGTDLPV